MHKLPKGLSTYSLFINDSNIEEIPYDLDVESFFCSENQIKNYPIVYDCGDCSRMIYLDFKNKDLIHIGCFKGTKELAIEAISKKYTGEYRKLYIQKVEKCFSLRKDI